MKNKITIIIILLISSISYSQVVINEILYDPTGTDTGLEWIELKNIGAGVESLTNYCLYASTEHYIFPSFTLNSGSYVVIHWNATGSDDATNLYTGTVGWLNMGNTAGSVAFFNTHSSHTSSTIIDFVEYGDSDNVYDGQAESAGIWTAGDFASDVIAGHSLEYDGSGDAGTDWFDQETPTQGADNALPVELSYFSAEQVLNGILLKWTTESEVENLGFLIERKSIDNDWQEIVSYKNDDSLLGQGTVSFATDYEYIDKLVQQGYKYDYRLADIDYNGVVTYHSTRKVLVENDPLATIVNDFTVTAYPNPFNPSTTIRYNIPAAPNRHTLSVRVNIYDITGKLINTLVNKEQTSGWYEVQWNGTNQSGNEVPGGIYLSRVTVGNKVKTNKLILLR